MLCCGDDDYWFGSDFGQGDKGVVAMTGCVDDLDAVGRAVLNALARGAFEYHHDWRVQPVPSLAARTRTTNYSAALARSRHQPVGRDPTTFAASINSTREDSHNLDVPPRVVHGRGIAGGARYAR